MYVCTLIFYKTKVYKFILCYNERNYFKPNLKEEIAMIKGFEDAFTDIQADYISLCMEYLEIGNIDANVVYVYLYQTEHIQMFNAFFKVGTAVITAGEVGSEELTKQFFDVGTEDIERLIEVCNKYEHPCPNELKLICNVQTGSFDADYKYEENPDNGNITPEEVFLNWISEAKSN